jgi:hypothetical protein
MGSCPSAELYGCCVFTVGVEQASCVYGDGGSLIDMVTYQDCIDAGRTWMSTAP